MRGQGRPVTVYVLPETDRVIQARATRSVSEVVGTMLQRYDEICKRELPAITKAQRERLIVALRGIRWGPHVESIPSDFAARGTGDTETEILLERCSYGQLVALADMIERPEMSTQKGGTT